jgi:hypothetical protein
MCGLTFDSAFITASTRTKALLNACNLQRRVNGRVGLLSRRMFLQILAASKNRG